jgi:hypothetical protein
MLRKLQIIVLRAIIVTLTGAGFGFFTGYINSEYISWTLTSGSMAGTASNFYVFLYVFLGLITGTVSSYIFAKWYLKRLMKISFKGATWLLSTLAAVYCGIIHTTFILGLFIFTNLPSSVLNSEGRYFSLLFSVISAIVGSFGGLLLGGICSLIYVLSVNSKSIEAA